MLVAVQRAGRSNGGGMERYLEVVLPALAARGAEVLVIARDVDGDIGGLHAEHVAWADEHDPPSDAAARECARRIDAFRPDVAVAHNVMDAGIVRALRRVRRFTVHVHDHRPFCPNGDRVFPRSGNVCGVRMGAPCALHALTDGCGYGARPRTLALVARRRALAAAYAAADAVIATSAFMRAHAVRSGVDAARVRVLPLPLPDDAYVRTPQTPAARTVVCAGRLVPQKGFASAIAALALIPRERRPSLALYGDGPERERLIGAAQCAGVTLRAPGAVAPEVLREALDAAALVVVPSLWAEPFGYIGIEAFARGRTVAAYEGGGVAAWLAPGLNGYAVPRGDTAALAHAIDTLLDDRSLRTALEARARRDAEKFRARPIVDALADAYAG